MQAQTSRVATQAFKVYLQVSEVGLQRLRFASGLQAPTHFGE